MISLSATVLGLALSGLTPVPVGADVPRPLQERLQLLEGHLEILSLRSHSASYVSGISNIVIGGLFGFLAANVSSGSSDPRPEVAAYSQAMGFFFWTLAITSVLDGVVELVFVPDGQSAYERFAELPADTEDQARHKVGVGRDALRGLASTAMLRRILGGGISLLGGLAVPIAYLVIARNNPTSMTTGQPDLLGLVIMITGALQAVQGLFTLLTRSPEEARWDLYRRQVRRLRHSEPADPATPEVSFGAIPMPGGGAAVTFGMAF